MRLNSQRLVIRDLQPADGAAIHEYEADPAAVRYTWHGIQTAEQTENRVRTAIDAARAEPRLVFDLAITLAGDGRLVGQCGFTRGQPDLRVAELWFILNPGVVG